ncbi:protein kinase [Nonomuraea wenchangensis]
MGPDVYLARSPADEQVLVRLLPADVAVGPFLDALGPALRVCAAGTAQVLGAGELDGRAYVVREHVEGPTLEEAGGSPDGVALHRLAVGTITALVAVHQAGAVHGDVRPGTVVLGPDGPRLVDLGLEQAWAAAAETTRKVAVPAFTAPERLRGGSAEPPGDVFSWAATMVYAVSGASPYEGGSMGATVDRILQDEPTLPDLGELRGLLTACLDKDPHARPVATEVLLRLVGQTAFLTGWVPAAPPPPRQGPSPPGQGPPARGRVPPAVAVVAAFTAGALVAGVAVYALTGGRAPVRPAAGPPATSAPVTITPSPAVAPKETVAPKAAADLPLPAIGATFHEHPDDRVRLASYLEVTRPYTGYVRERGGSFRSVGTTEEPVVAPGGDWVALNPWVKFQNSDMDVVKLLRLSTGESFTVQTARKPQRTMNPVWSRDGTKLLLTVINTAKEPFTARDFVLVDLSTRRALRVQTEYSDDASLIFTFAPDGTVVRGFFLGERRGIDFYNTSGQVARSMHWVGTPRDSDWFSPSGRQLVTVCPRSAKDLCVWDARTGARRATVPREDDEGALLGWFNESHLLVRDPAKKKGTAHVKIIDFVGRTERVLADVTPLKGLLRFGPVPR